MMGQAVALLIVWSVPVPMLPPQPPQIVEIRTFEGQTFTACEQWAFDQYPDRLRYRWACFLAKASLPLISRPQ